MQDIELRVDEELDVENSEVREEVPVENSEVREVVPGIEDLQHQLETVTQERDVLLAQKQALEKKEMALIEENKSISNKATVAVRNRLLRFFSPSQVDFFLSGIPVNRWSDDDIGQALTLRSLSPKAYLFLRDKWCFPFPSVSTLHRWSSKLHVEPGVLQPILMLLQHTAPSMPDRDRLCVLSFDETSVSQDWCYDKGTDILYSPKKKVQCVMIRGLVGSWKQLIFYDFDCDMSKSVLFDIIMRIEVAGFPVVAIVNDLSPTNVRLWNSLGISVEKSFFINPFASDRDVYVFADAPHIIKLIRNNFLDSGFQLSEGKLVLSGCVRELIQRSASDLKPAYRLSVDHVNVSAMKRMRVRLAVQLLSETTAKALQYFGQRGLLKSKNWHETSQFISLVDSWFDLFNSKSPHDSKPSRYAYGLSLQKQNSLLEEMIETIGTMRVMGRRGNLYPFQKGLIISSKSLPKLYGMIREKFHIDYILTNRLSQDGLEHFFSCLRQMGATYDHPSPLSVKHRVRSYLLGKEVSLVGKNYNTARECPDSTLSQSSFLKETTENVTEDSLDHELCLTAMLFSVVDAEETVNEKDQDTDFEQVAEIEGLNYLGGFIAKKFPQYEFLRTNAQSGNTWVDYKCESNGKLIVPSDEFQEQLMTMENLFKCHHGQTELKPGKGAIKILAEQITNLVSLPADVVQYFVRCRMFFRMRILNRNCNKQKQNDRKLKKLNK